MDPINPIAENPEALNTTPQPLNNSNNQPSNNSNGITVLSMAIFILLSLGVIVFLYYQNQQLKNMLVNYQTPAASPTPTPVATTDPTVNWKTYTNSIQNFTFKYDSSWTLDKKGDNEKLNAQIKLTRDKTTIQIYANMDGIGGLGRDYQGTKMVVSGITLYEYKVANTSNKTQTIGLTDTLNKSLGFFQQNGKTYSITLTYPDSLDQTDEGSNLQKEFNQILSTFKFTSPSTIPSTPPINISTPSGAIKACTMDAKICPDGSSVGRTGPNCEFAACPTN
jgi:hypothetical protein